MLFFPRMKGKYRTLLLVSKFKPVTGKNGECIRCPKESKSISINLFHTILYIYLATCHLSYTLRNKSIIVS